MADTDTTTNEPATGDATENTTDQLGDPGRKALDAERKARRDAEKSARELERRLKELEDRDKSDLQLLQETLAEKDAQLAELPKQIRSQVVRFASMASRAGFLDPEDALLNIDVDLGDPEAVQAALTDLTERKPHLVRQPATPKPADKLPARPTPHGGQLLGTPAGDQDAKERAAAALRMFRNT